MQEEAFTIIPSNIDGLEEASEAILSTDDPSQQKVLSDIKRHIERLRIKDQYHTELKERPGESEKIRKELAQQHHKSLSRIDWIVYKWK